MKITQTAFRVEHDLKVRVEDFLKERLNISATEAINAFYQYIDQHQSLPFVIQTNVSKPNAISKILLNGLLNSTISAILIADIVEQKNIDENDIQHHKDVIWEYEQLLRSNLSYINSVGAIESGHWKQTLNHTAQAMTYIEVNKDDHYGYSKITPAAVKIFNEIALNFQKSVITLDKIHHILSNEKFRRLDGFPNAQSKPAFDKLEKLWREENRADFNKVERLLAQLNNVHFSVDQLYMMVTTDKLTEIQDQQLTNVIRTYLETYENDYPEFHYDVSNVWINIAGLLRELIRKFNELKYLPTGYADISEEVKANIQSLITLSKKEIEKQITISSAR